jgi:hypothetical protein
VFEERNTISAVFLNISSAHNVYCFTAERTEDRRLLRKPVSFHHYLVSSREQD